MYNKHLFSLAIILTSLNMQSAFAACDYASDTEHCVYISGLTSPNEGRYIKFYSEQGKMSMTQCVNAAESIYVDATLGANTIQYYICSDIIGSQCEQVGDDTFTMIKKANEYIIDPKSYVIDLSKVQAQYPQCHNETNYSGEKHAIKITK